MSGHNPKWTYMDEREYDQLDSLTSSNNTEISRLSLIIQNLKKRLESVEKHQSELVRKMNDLQNEMDEDDDTD